MRRRPPHPTRSYTLTKALPFQLGKQTKKRTAVIRNRIKPTQNKTPGFQLVLLPFLPRGLCTCRPLYLKCPLSLLYLQSSAPVLFRGSLSVLHGRDWHSLLCSHCPGMHLSLRCCNKLYLRGPGSVLFILDTMPGLQWSPRTFCWMMEWTQ